MYKKISSTVSNFSFAERRTSRSAITLFFGATGKGLLMLNVTKQEVGYTTIFHCAGRITFVHANTLRDLIHRSHNTGRVVLDLGKVTAIDAAGLGALLDLRDWYNNTGTVLKLMNVTPRLKNLLELTKLSSAFEICGAREMLDLLCVAIRNPRDREVRAAESIFEITMPPITVELNTSCIEVPESGSGF